MSTIATRKWLPLTVRSISIFKVKQRWCGSTTSTMGDHIPSPAQPRGAWLSNKRLGCRGSPPSALLMSLDWRPCNETYKRVLPTNSPYLILVLYKLHIYYSHSISYLRSLQWFSTVEAPVVPSIKCWLRPSTEFLWLMWIIYCWSTGFSQSSCFTISNAICC